MSTMAGKFESMLYSKPIKKKPTVSRATPKYLIIEKEETSKTEEEERPEMKAKHTEIHQFN